MTEPVLFWRTTDEFGCGSNFSKHPRYLIQNFGKTIRKIRKEKINKRIEYAFFLWTHFIIDKDFENTNTLRDQICKLLNIDGKMQWPFDRLNPHGVKCLGTWEVLENEL